MTGRGVVEKAAPVGIICDDMPWAYESIASSPEETARLVHARVCIYCQIPLLEVVRYGDSDSLNKLLTTERAISACNSCGWWTASEELHSYCYRQIVAKGAVGSLCELDVSDTQLPIDEIRRYLRVRYSARFAVDPWRFEELVASVFNDLGYKVRVTGRSNDGGIDVMMDGPGDELIGVQVKRYRNAIKVDQIHSLAGALVRAGILRGIFVTTSRFQIGTHRAVNDLQGRGVAIDLIDAQRFYDALAIAQSTAPLSTARYHRYVDLHTIFVNDLSRP